MNTRSQKQYTQFIKKKGAVAVPTGFEPSELPSRLFDYQRDLVVWACRRGRAALFADTGLGKSGMQLAWADQVARHTGKPVIIFAPLAVAAQTVREAAAFGIYGVRQVREAGEIGDARIVVTNYERLEKFEPALFGGVVLDESGILKHHDAKTRARITEAYSRTPYRLACTATPAPNDVTELGNHAEFMGICSRVEMLSEYFTHDGGETQVWRLKGHARTAFWRWVCSWAAVLRSPEDLGYNGSAHVLPPLNHHEHIVSDETGFANERGLLFATDAMTLDDQRKARRASLSKRVDLAAQLVAAEPNEQWILWCELNDEGDALERAIPGSVQVSGSDTPERKEAVAMWFADSQQKGSCTCRGSLSTPRIDDAKSLQTQKRPESSKKASSERPLSEPEQSNSTSASTTSRTLKNTGERQTSKRRTTQQGEPSTSQTPSTGNGSNDSSKSGQSPTQTSKRTSGSAVHSESHSTTTGESSLLREEDARSASEQKASTSLEPESLGCSASTTATLPGESEGYSARPATSESGSLQTVQSDSKLPPCTCGMRRKVLISKSSIFGYGLNLQSCARVAFVGVGNSFESYYQAIRRCWRFGQSRQVEAHIVSSDVEGAVLANLKRKQADALSMSVSMAEHTRAYVQSAVRGSVRDTNAYNPKTKIVVPGWLVSDFEVLS